MSTRTNRSRTIHCCIWTTLSALHTWAMSRRTVTSFCSEPPSISSSPLSPEIRWMSPIPRPSSAFEGFECKQRNYFSLAIFALSVSCWRRIKRWILPLGVLGSELTAMARACLVELLVQQHDAVARKRLTHRAGMTSRLHDVIITNDHAQFCLAILIVDGAAGMLLEPANDLRVEWLASAISYAQLSFDLPGWLIAGGKQQSVGGWCGGQVGDVVLRQYVIGTLGCKWSIIQCRRVTD